MDTKVLEILKEEKEKFNIDKFVLFGSFVKSDEYNDIDIAYISNQKLNFQKYLELEKDLEAKLNTKIDLLNFDKINPLIKLNAKEDFFYV
jgi:predicted nucleotidyltransferase